jgi:dethiobiotin synthetase
MIKRYSPKYSIKHSPSPHYAAEIDGVTIDLNKMVEPETKIICCWRSRRCICSHKYTDCVIDLIKPDYKVIVVSRHYLGSINHTLLTIEALQNRKIKVAELFLVEKKIKRPNRSFYPKRNKFIGLNKNLILIKM